MSPGLESLGVGKNDHADLRVELDLGLCGVAWIASSVPDVHLVFYPCDCEPYAVAPSLVALEHPHTVHLPQRRRAENPALTPRPLPELGRYELRHVLDR